MIQIKFSWPMLFVAVIAILIWLARDPVQPAPASCHTTPRPQRTASRATARRMVIDQSADGSDYDAETKRLDREAANAGHNTSRPPFINPLRQQESYRDRARANA